MTRTLTSLLAAALLLLAGCATQPAARRPSAQAPAAHAQEAQARRTVLLVSIDAFRADYLLRGLTPTLQALADDGVHATAMQPSFPSLTFPNHYTLVTGLYPDHHGIVNNTMYDPRLGKFSLSNRKAVSDGRWWAEGEPVWVTADRHGLRTATMFWPGSEAAIRGVRPDHWLPYDENVTPARRVARVLSWLDLPPARRPDFLTLYFDRVDHAGHDFGPDSAEVDAAMARIDAALRQLVEGLKQRGLYDRIDIVVVSDHGMASSPRDHNILADTLIDLDHVRVVSMGELAGFNPKPGHEAEIETALLGPHAHMRCWKKDAIPARLHYGSNPRVPAIVCSPQTGWRISTRSWIAHRKKPLSLGSHGYDNADPRMRALFIAHGPDFRRGLVVPEFPNVDVYPLLMHLLGLPPQPNDGHFGDVAPMLAPAAR